MKPTSRLRFAVIMWLVGMTGVAVVALLVVPGMIAEVSGDTPIPAPIWVASAASLVQGAVILAMAVWAGVALAPKVGLRAPLFEALAGSAPVAEALRKQLVPGLLGGRGRTSDRPFAHCTSRVVCGNPTIHFSIGCTRSLWRHHRRAVAALGPHVSVAVAAVALRPAHIRRAIDFAGMAGNHQQCCAVWGGSLAGGTCIWASFPLRL
jgi:hypothetical protein